MPLPPHALDWMNRAEIDYIGPFVKAWAAFNAWYRHDSGQATERAMLDFAIQHQNSRLRRRFLPLLEQPRPGRGPTVTADEARLKQAICDLQQALDAIQFEVTRKGARERISLREVCIRPKNNWQGDRLERRGQLYAAVKVQGGAGQIEVTVTSSRTRQVKFQHIQPRYDPNDLCAQPGFTNDLSGPQRTTLRQFYDACNPRPLTDLVQGGGPVLDISTMQFQCRSEELLAGIVEILYAMRNALLHGEVDPDEQVLACYEPAYRIVLCFLLGIHRGLA